MRTIDKEHKTYADPLTRRQDRWLGIFDADDAVEGGNSPAACSDLRARLTFLIAMIDILLERKSCTNVR